MINIYQILGVISATSQVQKTSVFTVTSTETLKDSKIFCPFFCPARKSDVIAGMCKKRNDGLFEFLQCPLVEPSSDKDSVLNVFIIGMGKLRMSNYMADTVYEFFKQETIKKLGHLNNPTDKGSNEFAIYRNKDMLNSAVLETISWYANAFRIDEGTADALIRLGLTNEQAFKLLRSWYRSFCLRRLYLLGLTRKEIKECCDRGWVGSKGVTNSPDALYYQLIENPYIPEKIPLAKSKDIAKRYGLKFGQDMLESADLIRFVDEQTNENGWACYSCGLLAKRYPRFNELLETLKLKFSCTIRYNFFYLRHQAETEDTLLKYLESFKLGETHVSSWTKNNLCEEQIEAVEMSLNNSTSIITGAGGTGKTKTISSITHELDLREIPWCIGSFTGKAISNVKKVIGKRDSIMTLHMILSKGKVVDKLGRPVRTLIIDEISMVPNELLAKVLLKLNNALNEDQRLSVILVGDPNQIQPIEWGDFFNQVLSSWIFEGDEIKGKLAIPRTHLTQDHRRVKKGVLFNNMNQFSIAESPEEINFEWGDDCSFIQGGIVEIENHIRKLKESGVKSEDVVVLSPINKGLDDLNLRLRKIFVLTGADSILDSFGMTWFVGDRIMMTVNDYNINVMNGEEGVVTEIVPESSCIKCKFENGQEVSIPTFIPAINESYNSDEAELDAPLSTKLLILSWAVTIHKFQGSQVAHASLYIPPNAGKGSFFNIKLFYTGASRAREDLTIFAHSEHAVHNAILVNPPKRFDCLSKRLIGESFTDEYINYASKMNQDIIKQALLAINQ